ncbi:hypothetical protein MUP46_00765 [Patescibacteria group bacterium]|nr:hypothetical protein [Patescibacteria group bacterium]
MVNREQIVNRAKELIAQNPLWGKYRLNRQLRSEFGKGLRYTETLKLKRQAVIPETAREVQQTLNRRQSLTKEQFLQEEAIYYAQFPISTSGMLQLRRFRKTEIKRARRAGITPKRILPYIYESYKARGFIQRGRLDVNSWTRQVIAQLEKKPRQRHSVAIPPDNYVTYLKARKTIPAQDAIDLADKIPAKYWTERSRDYAILQQHHFSHWEIMQIITAQTPKDKTGNQTLQELDLTNPYWVLHMADRVKWYNDTVHVFMQRGMTRGQAHSATMRELRIYYDKDRKRKPWDWLKDFSPTKDKGAGKQIDFIDSARKRQERIDKKKMPYRASRR